MDFPSGLGLKNQPSTVGDMGAIPGWGTKNPTCLGVTKPAQNNYRACVLQLLKPMHSGACTPQLFEPVCHN